MRIAAIGYNTQTLRGLESENVVIDLFKEATSIDSLEVYDAFFLNAVELQTKSLLASKKVILVNSVIKPLEFSAINSLCYRVNHWSGFVENKEWEIVGEASSALDELLAAINKTALFVKNEIGLITPRILAMIINEAHYAIEEQVSSSSEIDVAMKLGTGYPKGPLEWGREIGLGNIYDLLAELSQSSERYQPSKLLTDLALNN